MLGPLALVLAGCAHLPVEADLGPWSWEVDRAAVPDADLYAMHVASVSGSNRLWLQGGKKGRVTGPISSYLVDHPTHGLVLIDTALGSASAESLRDYPGRVPTKALGLEMGVPVFHRLAEAGFDPADVKHIVCTHLHLDHAGGIADFPGAELWVDEQEWASAAKTTPLGGYRTGPYDDVKPHFLQFEGTEAYGPFPAHVDLFGDGSLIVLPSAGHTAGSVMVLVNLPEGSWLFMGDAAWLDEHWQGPIPKSRLASWLIEDDRRSAWEAIQRTHAWAKVHPDIQIVPGHEPATVERMDNWPSPENSADAGAYSLR